MLKALILLTLSLSCMSNYALVDSCECADNAKSSNTTTTTTMPTITTTTNSSNNTKTNSTQVDQNMYDNSNSDDNTYDYTNESATDSSY